MLTHSLGPFTFHGMWGAPKFSQAIIAGEVRPGVDGTAIYDMGKWGKPFQIETLTFVSRWSEAIAMCQVYSDAPGDNAYVLTQGDIEIPNEFYKVIEVDPRPKTIVRGKVAGDDTVYGAEVRCMWLLLPLGDP